MENKVWDVVIIGGGPAGLSAGLYAARGKMQTLLIEKARTGGQVNTTEEIENYPGSEKDAHAQDIMERMKEQAETFGTVIIRDNITGIEDGEHIKKVLGTRGEYQTKTVIIATGAEPKLLGAPGEWELRGKGVSYCATCDADFFTDLDVVIIGGGDSAVEEALYLTKFAESVTIVHRRDSLRAAKTIQDKAFANPKIKFIWNSTVEKIQGDEIVESVLIKNVISGEIKEMETNGVFIYVGMNPNTESFKDLIELDEQGYIITDERMATSKKGIFATGDVRRKFLRQVVTATADGAIAAVAAEKYIAEE